MGKFYFTCSFDDGDVADLRLVELLGKYNLKGTFYIPQTCDLVAKILSESQIREMAGVVEIGGHTISHQILTHINDESARAEVADCKTWLEDVTGRAVHSFCPPTGRFNSRHISFQQEAGFRSMRTVEMLSYSLRKIRTIDDFVILPTTSQLYNHTWVAYTKNSMKRLQFSNYPVFMKLFSADWELMGKNYIAYLNRLSKSRGGDYYFHLWGHSWEIEKYALWDGLERFFKHLSGIEDLIVCDNSELAEIVSLDKEND